MLLTVYGTYQFPLVDLMRVHKLYMTEDEMNRCISYKRQR